jgi:hypothetical protein
MQIRWCPTDGEDVLEGLGFKGLGCMETPSSVFCKKKLKIQVLCNIDAGGFQKTESRCNALFFFSFFGGNRSTSLLPRARGAPCSVT